MGAKKMADYVYIADLGKHKDKEITVKGWLYNKRSSGKIRFLIIRDGTGIVQSVLSKTEVSEEIFNSFDVLTLESSLSVRGVVREDKRAPGGHELLVKDLEIIQVSEEYPITLKEHGTGFLMEHRHLWLRSKKQVAVLRIRNELCQACRDFYYQRGFVLIDSPILTPTSVEGTTTLFETEYFDEKAYLTQSGQLYQEPACMAFGKVYCFGPTFRAEKSKTRRHLTEFWMLEPEVAFAELDDIIELAEDFVVYIVGRVLERCGDELKTLERDTSKLEEVKKPFPRISYDEAVEILRKNDVDFKWGADFGGPDETVIASQFSRPLVIHRFPEGIKPFYMQPDPERPEVVLGMDVIAPEGYGEIIGGGQRIHDHDLLLEKLKKHNLPIESYQWYLDIRKYGSVPHSGFGLGLERTISWVSGLSHIRETIPYPRTLYRLYP